MQSFKEWCDEKYGIKEIAEGKITNLKFIPSRHPPHGVSLQKFTPANGSIYQYLREKLKRKEGDSIEGFIATRGMRIDPISYPQSFEYKTPAPVYLRLSDKHKFDHHFKGQFLRKHRLPSAMKVDPMTRDWNFLAQPEHLEQLYKEYSEELELHKQKNPPSLDQLNAWEKRVNNLIDIIKDNPQLEDYLQKAHHLSKDFTNDRAISNQSFEACSGYSVSLQIYAELYREFLSDEDYARLQHTIDMLGRGQDQGLKTDANFMHYLITNLSRRDEYPNAEVNGQKPIRKDEKEYITWNGARIFNPLRNRAIYPELREKINDNIDHLLYGKARVDWWGAGAGKAAYKMRRFLPDEQMNSETNEITLQGGRMINHSAMLRIIKVGITSTDEVSNDPKEIHHFDYYHVQTNLGAECNNPSGEVCDGTYITKLEPTRSENGKIIHTHARPSNNPKAYQEGMEHTIRQLIKTERHLCFYRKPELGRNNEDMSPAGSPEALEWTRLNDCLNLLKGRPIPKNAELTYYSIGLDGSPIKSTMKNQVNFTQDGGSCSIFSIKQLVTSVLDTHFTSLHSNFLQLNDGKMQVVALNKLLEDIKKQKAGAQAIIPPKPVDKVVPPRVVPALNYFQEQMNFITRFLENNLLSKDLIRYRRIIENQKKQSIEFLDEFLNITPGQELATSKLNAFPVKPKNFDEVQQHLGLAEIRFSIKIVAYHVTDSFMDQSISIYKSNSISPQLLM